MTVLSIPTRSVATVTTRRHTRVRPAVELARMTRYRGGTYSHTVDKIVFTDGTTARTDLIRLNPNLQAYSLDFTGIAPHHPSPYRLEDWSALPHLHDRACEGEVDWILRHSYPMRSLTDVSQQLRRSGYPLGAGNISEHEAIAATQAAVWHFTNGLTLDTRPLNAPIAVNRGPGPALTFEFEGQPQLGGYSVWTSTATSVWLQKSIDGVVWHDISGSVLKTGAGKGCYRRTLGVGSTTSTSNHGRGARGYRFYRLINEADTSVAPIIDHVDFRLTGSRQYRNADRIVHLYNYLLAGAYTALPQAGPALVDTAAFADSDLVGPFQVGVPMTLTVAGGQDLVDADGSTLVGVVSPGTDFYIRRSSDVSAATLTATPVQQVSGPVLTGVALAGPAQRLTPVALTTPRHVTMEIDITWKADQARADIVGECA